MTMKSEDTISRHKANDLSHSQDIDMSFEKSPDNEEQVEIKVDAKKDDVVDE